MAESQEDVPTARTGAAMTVTGDKMLVWGGFTQEIDGEGDDRCPVNIPLPEEEDEDYPIEEYDIIERRWRRHKTTGKDGDKANIPAFGSGSVMLSMGGLVYLFGGWNDQQFSNNVFRLDPVKMVWEKLEVRSGHPPVCKCYCGMVQHDGKLVVFGGIGTAGQAGRGGGAKYITCHDTKITYDYCWNNELHSFDPNTGQSRGSISLMHQFIGISCSKVYTVHAPLPYAQKDVNFVVFYNSTKFKKTIILHVKHKL